MRGSTRRAALTGTFSRKVPAGRSRNRVDHVECRLNLGQRRAEPLEQALAGLGRGDASGRAIEQPHAELRFQPAHASLRLEALRPAGARGLAKAPGRATATKDVEIIEIGPHCSIFRTARVDYGRLSRIRTLARLCPLIRGDRS